MLEEGTQETCRRDFLGVRARKRERERPAPSGHHCYSVQIKMLPSMFIAFLLSSELIHYALCLKRFPFVFSTSL